MVEVVHVQLAGSTVCVGLATKGLCNNGTSEQPQMINC